MTESISDMVMASLSQQTLVDFDSQYETVEMHFLLRIQQIE
ncbi:hypothetical protein QW060_23535 [Myroides ceti]|uniref:Uncharacterized protein n=1 Tax=Paenimyroides ceti TaxID=395087 RepID=A0ABT8D0T2_9FLAO|nr:hypothetical protein [Paenimyroides ceti]MDN3709891.1 hypothetical protein [Paenimyroides ceti]